MWDYVNKLQMRDYLWREIGVNGRPVALFNGKWEHAVVVVGYDGTTFEVHDPASTTMGSIGYGQKAWSEFVDGMAVNDKLVTLVVPKDLPANPGRVAASFLPNAFQFIKPNYGPDEPSAIWRFGWDHERAEGYSIRHASTDALGDPLPGEVSTLQVNGDIQLTNGSRTTASEVGVFLDVTALGAPSGQGRLSTHRTVTVPANAAVNLDVPDIPVDTFRYNIGDDVEYLLSAIVRGGGETLDWQTVRFKLAPVTPVIEAVQPAAAAVGDQVRIRGKKLGFLALNNAVKFNGEEADSIVSWSDDEITVIVPDAATTGPLLVERGEIASNSVDFTVSEFTTLNGSVTAMYGNEVVTGLSISVAGDWSLRAMGAELDYMIPETRHHSFYAKLSEPGTLSLDFSGATTPAEIPVDGGGKIVILPLEWSFNPSSSGSAFPWSGSGSEGSQSWSFTFQTYNDMFCANPYFAVYGDVYDAGGNLTQAHAFLNGRTVGIFCVKPGY